MKKKTLWTRGFTVILLMINFLINKQASRPFPTDSSPKHSDAPALGPQGMRDKDGSGWEGAMGTRQWGRLELWIWREETKSWVKS